jgi:hypothetical protein
VLRRENIARTRFCTAQPGKIRPVQWIVVGVAVVAALGIAWAVVRNVRRGRALRQQFGPEYARVLAEQGDREIAELELEQRRRRRMALEIRPLDADLRGRYTRRLEELQAGFDTRPAEAVSEIDSLVVLIMQALGYPAESFRQSVADISVDHPDAAQEYRAARALATWEGPGDPSAEQLRTAFTHYEALVRELLAGPADEG